MSLNNKSVGLTVYENGSNMSTKQFMSVWDQVVHTDMAQPSFCGIKWLWHFYSPAEWDRSPLQGNCQFYICQHHGTPGWREVLHV